jgi:hypothetical protein
VRSVRCRTRDDPHGDLSRNSLGNFIIASRAVWHLSCSCLYGAVYGSSCAFLEIFL